MANTSKSNYKASEKVRCSWQGCEKRFTRKSDMERHYSTIHLQEKLYHCPVEGCETNKALRKDKLKDHIVKEHGSGSEGHEKVKSSQSTESSTLSGLQISNGSTLSTTPEAFKQASIETATTNCHQGATIEFYHESERETGSHDLHTWTETLPHPQDYILPSQPGPQPTYTRGSNEDLENTASPNDEAFADWMNNNFDDGDISTWSF